MCCTLYAARNCVSFSLSRNRFPVDMIALHSLLNCIVHLFFMIVRWLAVHSFTSAQIVHKQARHWIFYANFSRMVKMYDECKWNRWSQTKRSFRFPHQFSNHFHNSMDFTEFPKDFVLWLLHTDKWVRRFFLCSSSTTIIFVFSVGVMYSCTM